MTEFSKGDRVEVKRYRWSLGAKPEEWWCPATVIEALPGMITVRYDTEGHMVVRRGRGLIRRAEA